MTDNDIIKDSVEITDDYIVKIAPWICCPMCDEKECVGRDTCITLKEFVKRRVKKNDRHKH